MKYIYHLVSVIALFILVGTTILNAQKSLVIDERKDSLVVTQTIEIDQVWAGHPVGFCLLTEGDRQYVAYYNANRSMVVGQRNLDEEYFDLTMMPTTSREIHGGTSTVLGWDSHNSITMAIDKEGYIHLTGNMHVNPLTYFRSTKPNDISSLKQVMKMVGTEEDRATYPNFMKDRDGQLIFHYRDGGSGNGNEIYNIYSTKKKSWTRLLDVPLTDGQGLMNAYQSTPKLMEDGWYHMYWVWRDTPDCATNHDLSYMKSPDLIHWYDAYGDPIELPATLDQKSLIVDPIPPGGGIINLAARLSLDDQNKPVFVYHKYDADGNLQLYIARFLIDEWVIKPITDWEYRWEFSGRGSIDVEVRIKGFNQREDGNYEIDYWHIKHGHGTLLLNRNFNVIGKVIKPKPLVETLPVEGEFPGLKVRLSSDNGSSESKDKRYLLKWETLDRNRDRPRPKPWPEPSTLYLYKVE